MNNASNPRFPNIEVKLSGQDGNAFSIITRVGKALKGGGATEKEVDLFYRQAMSGDYGNVLRTAMAWVHTS